MRALQLTGPGHAEVVSIPDAHAGDGEVLLQIKAASICNQHDMRMFQGEAGREKGYPAEAGLPGHEGVGVIAEVGRGVTGIRVGDHVVTSGIGGPPLYREFVVRRADAVARVSQTLPFTAASPLELYGCLRRAIEWAERLADTRVGVMGLGPAGLAAVDLLHAEGARSIVGMDLNEARRTRALGMGADEVVDTAPLAPAHRTVLEMLHGASPTAAQRAVLERIQALGIDTVIDCTGNPDGLSLSFLVAAREVVVFGFVHEETKCLPAVWFSKQLTIRNSKELTLGNLRTVARLASDGIVHPEKLVTHVLPFDRYTGGLELVRTGAAVKVALVWEGA